MAPSRPFEVVEKSIRYEFGKGVIDLFASFEPTPIAAASVAYASSYIILAMFETSCSRINFLNIVSESVSSHQSPIP